MNSVWKFHILIRLLFRWNSPTEDTHLILIYQCQYSIYVKRFNIFLQCLFMKKVSKIGCNLYKIISRYSTKCNLTFKRNKGTNNVRSKRKFKLSYHQRKKGATWLTVCVILHPLIDTVSHSYILTKVHMVDFCIKILLYHLQKLFTDRKSILHKEGIGNFHHILALFSSYHVRKIL